MSTFRPTRFVPQFLISSVVLPTLLVPELTKAYKESFTPFRDVEGLFLMACSHMCEFSLGDVRPCRTDSNNANDVIS